MNDASDNFDEQNETTDAIEPEVVLDLTEDGNAVDVEDEEDDGPRETPAWEKPGRWYVVHTQSGYEKKVEVNLKIGRAHV